MNNRIFLANNLQYSLLNGLLSPVYFNLPLFLPAFGYRVEKIVCFYLPNHPSVPFYQPMKMWEYLNFSSQSIGCLFLFCPSIMLNKYVLESPWNYDYFVFRALFELIMLLNRCIGIKMIEFTKNYFLLCIVTNKTKSNVQRYLTGIGVRKHILFIN